MSLPRNRPHNPLTPRQKQAAQLLVAGKSTAQVAQELSTTYTTVYRWQRIRIFNDYVDSLAFPRDSGFQETLEGGAKAAVRFLKDLSQDATQPMKDRIKAAGILVDSYIKATQQAPTGKVTESQEMMAFLEALPG